MDRIILNPNLPENDVSVLAMGAEYVPIFSSACEKRGVEILTIPVNPFVDPRLSSHADLSLLHLNAQMFVTLGNEYIALPVSCSSILRIQNISHESALNLCIVGDYVTCCEKTAAMVPSWLTPIFVNQHYARCSICVVDEKSIITADHGIAQACKDYLDVLEIQPGHIDLPGFNYGFIGGCSFKLGKERLAFTGTLDYHPDKEKILRFLSVRSIEPVYLLNRGLLDIGSAVPIQEKR